MNVMNDCDCGDKRYQFHEIEPYAVVLDEQDSKIVDYLESDLWKEDNCISQGRTWAKWNSWKFTAYIYTHKNVEQNTKPSILYG